MLKVLGCKRKARWRRRPEQIACFLLLLVATRRKSHVGTSTSDGNLEYGVSGNYEDRPSTRERRKAGGRQTDES